MKLFQSINLKAPITIAADDGLEYVFRCFSEKIRIDVSSESSAGQRIHVKNQVLFSSKDKSEKLKCRLLQFLIGALRASTKLQFQQPAGSGCRGINYHFHSCQQAVKSADSKTLYISHCSGFGPRTALE